MNEQTIEMQIRAKAQEALQSINKLTSQLTGVEKKIDSVKTTIDKVSTTKAKNEMNSLNSSIEKASKSMEKFKSLFTFAGAKRLTKTALGWINEGIDYTEQLNLFNVVFDNVEKNGKTMYSNLGKEAIKYQNKLNEAFGTNKTQTLYMQGIYQSMAETVNIPEYYASIMSETSTKLTYDLASLFNKQESATAEAIRAGIYAGQTKPLRAYGIDVTQMSMQPILDELGITDRSVKEMSQAEKEILRYLATLQQARNAMGDLANTIESPSNQLKVFRQQLVEAKVAMSSLFIGSLQKILPYANAFLMVVKEISKAIADMFGIELKDYNSGIASSEDAFVDLGDSVDDAIGKVKELKRQVLGFDQIHNINENKDSGSGSLVGGIDQRLLDAIHGYDNGMDKVRMKATEIRDRIMEWLGFTKEIDPLTGEVGFKLKDGETRFGKILEWVKKIKDVLLFGLEHADIIIGTILGYKLATKVSDITISLGKIPTAFSNIGDAFKKLKTIGNNVFGTLKTAGKEVVDTFNIIATAGTKGLNPLQKLGTASAVIASAIGLAEAVSTTDIYQQITGNKGDLFEMWGKIGSGMKELQEIKEANARQSMDNVLGWLAIGNKALDQGNTEILEHAKEKLKNYNETYVAILAKLYSENKSFVDQMYFGTNLFDDTTGINISRYTDSLKDYFNTITNGSSVVSEYNQIIKESEASYASAEEGLEILLAQMDTDQYQVTENDINKINNCLKRMADASNKSGQAFVDAVTSMTIRLKNQGLVSDETAKKVIENAKKKQLAEQGFTEEYINKVTELDNKLRNNEITNKEYTDSLIQIYNQYNKTTDIVKSTTSSLDILSQGINITGENWNELSSTTSTASELYNEALGKVKDTTQENIKVWGDYLSSLDEGSEEYKLVSEMIQKENDAQNQSISNLEKGYATYLNNILKSLVNSKQITTKEGQDLYKSLNAELCKIGYGVDGDIQKNLDKIKEQLKMNDVKLGSGITFDGSGITTGWNNTITKLYGVASKLSGNISSMLGINLPSLASLKIPAYANGGMPEDGLFFANHNELVGKFSNGKTAVANNEQIIDGIKAGVYEAVVMAMSQYNGGQASEIDVHVHTDEGTVIDRIEQRTKQTGQFPFTIPTY